MLIQTLVDEGLPLTEAAAVVARTYDRSEGDDAYTRIIPNEAGVQSVGAYALYETYRSADPTRTMGPVQRDARDLVRIVRADRVPAIDLVETVAEPSPIVAALVAETVESLRFGQRFDIDPLPEAVSVLDMAQSLYASILEMQPAVEGLAQISVFDGMG